ncbi:MAG: two-component regulator propeller domain-containing protein [Panacibacter sp.]
MFSCNRTLKALLLSAYGLIQFNYCISQNLYFQSYSSPQGLSQNSVYSIAETREGFMWFGTQDGINRFDGKNFTVIKPAMHTASSKEQDFGRFSKMITALYADSNDWLWVGTTNRIALYNRYADKFFLPEEIYKGFILKNTFWINNITEDNNKNVWIATQDSGLFCYSKRMETMVSISWENETPKKIIAFTCDRNGNAWVCSESGLYKWDKTFFRHIDLQNKMPENKIVISGINLVNNRLWCIVNGTEIIILNAETNNNYSLTFFSKEFEGKKFLTDINTIHQSDSNTVWVGSRSDGLIKINLLSRTFENANTSGSGFSLKKQSILSFFTNNQQITWIGLSGGGIAKYDLQKIRFDLWRNESIPGKPSPDNMILSIFSPDDENFYMGTLHGGLLHTNTNSGEHEYLLPPLNEYDKSGANNIYGITEEKNNVLWMAAWTGIYSFDRITKHFNQYSNPVDQQTKKLCSVIKLKNQNKLLAGGWAGKIRLFNLETKQWEQCKDPKNILENHLLRVRYMKEMENGNIYMSTETESLVRYNYLTGELASFPQFEIVSGTSRYFCFENNNLWIATDDGLIQASPADMNIIKIWDTENDLPNNVIYSIVPDDNGRIWISSNGGLALLDYKTGICKKFTEDDGLQGMEFNTASCYKDKAGNIWFGGVNGFNKVKPLLSKNNDYAPVPLLTIINVMNIPYKSDSATPYIHSITLPYSKNFISFEFKSPDFSQSENIIYEYMLKGVDTGWVNNGTRNFVNYTQLTPGAYTFYVRSANNNGIWSKSYAELKLLITQPWFKTWWFYSLLVTTIAVSIYLFFRYRINQVRKVERMRQHISADLHDDIGASLTSINILSQLSQQQKIDTITRNEYLKKINDQTAEVTDALRDIVWSINPKNDKLDIIIARMNRYAAELLEPKNIAYSFSTNISSANETLHPDIRQNLYLIFKEALNNLAKYAQATEAVIVINKLGSQLHLQVKDNGKGFDIKKVSKGNGIENMQRRAKAIHAVFNLTSGTNDGTVLTVDIPV